jgi:hypothetical protein
VKPEITASRAEIVEDPETGMLMAGDVSDCFCIVNTKTGAVVGIARSLDLARQILDKRNRDFGASVHKIVPPVKPAPVG